MATQRVKKWGHIQRDKQTINLFPWESFVKFTVCIILGRVRFSFFFSFSSGNLMKAPSNKVCCGVVTNCYSWRISLQIASGSRVVNFIKNNWHTLFSRMHHKYYVCVSTIFTFGRARLTTANSQSEVRVRQRKTVAKSRQLIWLTARRCNT